MDSTANCFVVGICRSPSVNLRRPRYFTHALRRTVDEVNRCAALIDSLVEHFLQLDFRNGPLRKKYDSLKYTQKKLETLLYELELSKHLAISLTSAKVDPELGHAEQRPESVSHVEDA